LFIQNQVQDDLVYLQPGFKKELLISVEVFHTDVGDYTNNYDIVSKQMICSEVLMGNYSATRISTCYFYAPQRGIESPLCPSVPYLVMQITLKLLLGYTWNGNEGKGSAQEP